MQIFCDASIERSVIAGVRRSEWIKKNRQHATEMFEQRIVVKDLNRNTSKIAELVHTACFLWLKGERTFTGCIITGGFKKIIRG